MAQTELLLAFDIGTTAVKGGVYTAGGKCLFSSGVAYAKVAARAGWVEQNPQDWIDCMLAIIDRARQQLDLERIGGIGICSQVNTHVFVGGDGRALANAIVWEDQRCAEVAGELNARLVAGTDTRAAVGTSPLDSSSLVCRAEWVKRYQPAVWRNTRCILSPKDYCILQLTGELVSDALSSVGLVDAADNYLDTMLDLVAGLRERLPPLRPVTEVIGEVGEPSWGVRKGCPVVTGTMDCWASLFGSGAFAPGRGIEVAGTSEILGLVSRQAREATGVVTFPVYRDLYLHAGPTQAGGDALRWFAGAQDSSVAALLDEVEAAESLPDPLVFLPYLMGERAPLWDPRARGAFIGLTKDHRRACMVRAILEGVAFSARHLMEHLERAAGYHCAALVISGGASRSDLWCQLKADILQRALHRVENTDTGTFGASLMAATGIGIYSDLDEAAVHGVVINRIFAPSESHSDRYEGLYRVYRESYRQLQPVFDSLYNIRC